MRRRRDAWLHVAPALPGICLADQEPRGGAADRELRWSRYCVLEFQRLRTVSSHPRQIRYLRATAHPVKGTEIADDPYAGGGRITSGESRVARSQSRRNVGPSAKAHAVSQSDRMDTAAPVTLPASWSVANIYGASPKAASKHKNQRRGVRMVTLTSVCKS